MVGEDGKLRLPMDRLNAFFKANKGKRLIVRFEAATPGTSEMQLAYYYHYVIPTVKAALWDTGERKTSEQTDEWLRSLCPSCYDEEGGLIETREMSMPDFSDYLDWLKQFAAENLSVYIEDPRTI